MGFSTSNSAMNPIHVLVADSSPFICRLLKTYLESVPDIQVTGTATNGYQAIQMAEQLQPDVITLCLELPDMNGIEVLKAIQNVCPAPVIIISGANLRAASLTLQALNEGAIDYVNKFSPGSAVDPAQIRQEIIYKVRNASHQYCTAFAFTAESELPETPTELDKNLRLKKLLTGFGVINETTTEIPQVRSRLTSSAPEKIIVIGASTGGPIALRQVLNQLPEDFPGAILIVQHLPASFTHILAEQLSEQTPLPVREATDGEKLTRSSVLIAPGGMHLQIDDNGRIKFFEAGEINGYCPSIDLTMQSVGQAYHDKARGVLLTGMGNDGVKGMTAIRHYGGRTFAQAPETCSVDGMPQRAIEAGAVDHIAPPEHIARLLMMGY